MYFKALIAFAMVAGYCYAGPVETTPTPLTTVKPGNLSGLVSDSLPNAENATNVTTTKKPSRRELTTPLPMNDTAPMPAPGKIDSKICLDHIPSDEQIMARIMDCGLLEGDKIDSKAAADKLAACNKTGSMPPAKSLSRRELKEMMDKKKKEDKKEEKKEDKKEEPKPDEMKEVKEDLPADGKPKKKPEEKMPARRGLPKADDKNSTFSSNSTDKHNATDCDKKDLKVDPVSAKNDTKPDMPTTAAPSRRRRDAYGKSEVKSEPKYATRSSSYSSRVMKEDSYSAPAVREESYSAPAVKTVKESYAPAVKSESYSAPAVREESYAVKTVKEDSYSAPQREASYTARVVKRGPVRSSY